MATPATTAITKDLTFYAAPGTTDGAVLGYDTTKNVGFFGVVPVAQQTATDLASVIALLKAYGLSK